LKNLDVLVDVGSEYNPETLRFDHHQRSFAETFSPDHKIRLSSAGLIFKHFGRKIIAARTKIEDSEKIEVIFNRLYSSFVEAMDAIDNGVNKYPSDVQPVYQESTSLPSRVERLNPDWNETLSDDEIMARFKQAIVLCGVDFEDALKTIVKSWLPARQYVLDAIQSRFEFHPSGSILYFEQFVPWKNHFFTFQKMEERDLGESSLKDVYYVVYHSGDQYRYINIPPFASSFDSRLNVPKEWCGFRDAELDAITGVPGCTFVHHSGFTGGNKTLEGLVQMLEIALQQKENEPQAKKSRSD